MPKFICTPEYDSFTFRFPVTLREVEMGGSKTTQNVTLPKVQITDRPTRVNEEQAKILRESEHYGTFFVELDEAKPKKKAKKADEAPEVAPPVTEEPEDPVPASDETAASPNIYGDVEENGQAASILVSEYGVSEDDLKSEAGNITKKAIRAAAEAVGVAFPNL